GSDSHTPTAGGMGMIAIGAGGLDVALAMAGKPFVITWPKFINVRLTGKLCIWVSAKDVILHLLQLLSTKGNGGCLIEYTGTGVAELSVPQRATITNMGAELGVITSIFPSDEVTKQFLEAQGRGEVWQEILAGDGATYERTIEIDLSRISPLFAAPHSPDNIISVKKIAGTPVDQVCIGSCTNSSYHDLMLVATLLKGRKIAPGLSLIITPGSRQVLEMLAGNGALADLIAAGARIAESSCGFCIGQGHAPGTEALSIRTSNRNFKGRSGTASADIYLASPETAAAAALTGVVTDPRNLKMDYPEIPEPEEFLINDSMFIFPPKDGSKVEILRGPNIGEPPLSIPLPKTLKGVVAIKVGDKVTTDHIMPAGARLKYRSNVKKYSEFVFEPLDPAFPARCLENQAQGLANIIVAGESYGQGSSREHAAICPMYLGVRAVLAKSLERIHTANLINFGILPLVFIEPGDYDKLEKGAQLVIEDLHEQIKAGGEIIIVNKTKKTEILATPLLNQDNRDILLAGGRLMYERTQE
ncbi:MAG: aconitate hydratase, partial [Planctomycetes bacterium]|nr:aconitate hydratase [Planctomycetota bacterium]